MAGVVGVFKGSKYHQQYYVQSLKMMFDVCSKARKEGLMCARSRRGGSPRRVPSSPNIRVLRKTITCAIFFVTPCAWPLQAPTPFDLDQLMDLDMEVHHHSATQPVSALSTMADSLPGLGIVAAVLGVVITMGASGRPSRRNRQESRRRSGGNVPRHSAVLRPGRPIAANMAKIAEEEHAFLYGSRVLMVSFLKGTAPIMAVEVARRAVPGHLRPSFQER